MKSDAFPIEGLTRAFQHDFLKKTSVANLTGAVHPESRAVDPTLPQRDCLWGEILRAQSLRSSTAPDLAGLIRQVQQALPVPIAGVITDGQDSLRKAVAQALPGVPH